MASKVKAVVVSLIPMTPAQRVKFEEGIAAFPSFCHEWEQKLRDRELNNLDHLAWQVRDGYETATYIGYSNVESCETKPTRTTLLGKLKYEELRYYLVGKTVDEAKHAKPKVIGTTDTLEIFSWDRDRWFY